MPKLLALMCFLVFACHCYAANPYINALDRQWNLLDEYCITCHNFDDDAGGLSLEIVLPEFVGRDAKIWEKAIRKLQTGMMPPPGEVKPTTKQIKQFVNTLASALDYEWENNPYPGSVALHRLNRNEYANAVRDLLQLKIDPTQLLPRDDESHGFINNASVLKVSPAFLEQTLLAAREVSTLALGNADAKPREVVYNAPTNADDYVHIDGLPLGTKGGFLIEHIFPADGEYELSLGDLVGAVYVWGVMEPNTIIITVDDEKVFQQSLGGVEDLRAVDLEQAGAVGRINARFQNIRVPISTGLHRIGVTYLAKTAAESHDVLHTFVPVAGMQNKVQGNSYGPSLNKLLIKGPFNVSGINNTASRRKVFSCYPKNLTEEAPCARKIIQTIAAQAFRRDITDTESKSLFDFYQQGYGEGGFESGIQKSLLAILANPKFLYRGTADENPQEKVYSISNMDLASRLAFFLWSSLPDTELLDLAKQGRLSETMVLNSQIQRMLQDSKAQSLVNGFTFQWLNVQGLNQVEPDTSIYPEYTPDLVDDFKTELRLFVASLFSDDRPITELLTAKHTFVNERLALHYGIDTVRGGQFRRVEWQDTQRYGLLGKGAILMTTSYSNRTSPVVRGAYVLEKFLGVSPPPPPPNVEAFPENQVGITPKTVRERLEQHRQQQSCNACHAIIDPPGLALENFNAVGQWRDKDRDTGTAIDAAGELIDGTPIRNPQQLNRVLLGKPERFVQTFVERLMAYALGRNLEYYDMPTVRKIVRDTERDDFRLSAIVTAIINSPAFLFESEM